MRALTVAIAVLAVLVPMAQAQDGASGAVRITVVDSTGAAITNARVLLSPEAARAERALTHLGEGVFSADLLPPGDYELTISADGMAPESRRFHADIGAVVALHIMLKVEGAADAIQVTDATPLVESEPSSISAVIPEKAIVDLPLNGRRFGDLAMLAPGVTSDPRGMTSNSLGDLAFGGIRGFQTSFLVDGSDNNNSFFSQARGRYRAPYQFSNEVVQEFRVSSNTYGAELGRSGGAVINVATKSGGNDMHGTAFWYLRDGRFNAQSPYVDVKPSDKQNQVGGTIGGPLVKDRAFWFVGFDQHVFHIPTVVRFVDGSSVITPAKTDYDSRDRDLVFAAAQRLNEQAGTFRSALVGNAALAKIDWTISPRELMALRFNTSRYWGNNNVFFDPASPITTFGMSDNGEESVHTETVNLSLRSAFSARLTGHARMQFSRDLQASSANSDDVRTRIYGIIDGIGRSSILPRQTREHKLNFAETLSVDGSTHRIKFGADIAGAWIRNFFPMMNGGEFMFDDIRVSQFTFKPQTYGLELTPLRAYAHGLARYYIQNFGNAVSHPDTTEYAAFAQDTVRVVGRLAVTLGLRYDLQTFRSLDLPDNPLWPQAGKLPLDRNNVSPRFGFAYSLGEERPLVIRGGYGVFYTRIPQIYNSAVETDNGLAQQHLYLTNANYFDRPAFPTYPQPLVNCGPGTLDCLAPAAYTSKLTTEISAFAPNFQTPYVQQASLNIERELADRIAASISYMYVHGTHLIRARDMNLPTPVVERYPVFDATDTTFTGSYYDVPSFATWTAKNTLACPFPPCLTDLARPVPQLGAVDVFESAGSSVYHGMTVSVRRRMSRGLYFHAAYTFARAIDDGQDSLVVGRPATVQNTFDTAGERGLSTTDQRHRFIVSWIAEPSPFHREHPVLKTIFNNWKFSGLVSFGSGRPATAHMIGDANLDGNTDNDRLPGVGRNSYTGPDYSTTDTRVTRKLHLTHALQAEFAAEAFNLMNRRNDRLDSSDDGFSTTAATFVNYSTVVSGKRYPAHFRKAGGFLIPTNSYAPRQVQFAIRLKF